MKLQLEALDPLFFRDGRPFTMGEETYAEGIFPPLPSTLRGALRSMWISQQLDTADADKDALVRESNTLELKYAGLGIAGKPVYPAPLDLFFSETGTTAAEPMKLIKPNFSSSCPADVTHLFKTGSDGKTESIGGHLLDLETMERYLSGNNQTNFETKRLSDYLNKEHKIGIGRDNELNRTKDGLLFRLIANRFEDIKDGGLHILIDIEGFENLEKIFSKYTVMPLGGERRSVAAQPTKEVFLPKKPKIQDKFLKLIFLTPAVLDGWYPKLEGLKLVAASIGKPISVGGWDVLKQQPKPMRRAVPAGSVYLFEANTENHANEIKDKYHGESIYPASDERHSNGFGICLIAQPFDN